ncbi:MAG: response regulator, partial [Tepidisphaeraceae bacterium]
AEHPNPAGNGDAVAPAASISSLRGMHLLVAEDNEMNQFVTQQTLERAGCTCDIVDDGIKAVQSAQSGKYDLVLMDCQMPRLDGLEASRQIRQWEDLQAKPTRLPIIALTAEAISGDRDRCMAAGMDGYVTKPINGQELFAAIAAVARGRPKIGDACPLDPATSGQPPIDVESLFRRCMRDADFATRLLEQFDRRAAQDIDLLRRGISTGDIEGTTRRAHNLKSVAAHIGAGGLREIALEIEQAGARGDAGLVQRHVQRLADEARRCADYIPRAIESMAKMTEPSGAN